MGRKKDVEKLANIIKNFRKGELDIKLDERHVEKWLSQFSEESQDVILKETTRIFDRWYFNKNYIQKEFLNKVVDDLFEKYSFRSISDLCENVVFVSVQDFGQSQRMLIDMLDEQVQKKYGTSIQREVTNDRQFFVYLDDGLYTGSRARNDIEYLLTQCLCEGDSLDVFYMVSSHRDLYYSNHYLEGINKECGINLSIVVYNGIDKRLLLWPSEYLQREEEADIYEKFLSTIPRPKHPYRYNNGNKDPGIFSSAEARYIVEREFLRKGIDIYSSMTDPKGKYPLGYSLWSCFGFGSFCASDLNIPNTCPLVLWWGNVRKCEDALDNWYPLLPRRTNLTADGMEECAW